MPIVEEFKDIAGRKRKVLRVNREYMVDETALIKRFFATPADAIDAENANIIKRYARNRNTTVTRVKEKLASDSDFLVKERRRGVRFALSREALNERIVLFEGLITLDNFGFA